MVELPGLCRGWVCLLTALDDGEEDGKGGKREAEE